MAEGGSEGGVGRRESQVLVLPQDSQEEALKIIISSTLQC